MGRRDAVQEFAIPGGCVCLLQPHYHREHGRREFSVRSENGVQISNRAWAELLGALMPVVCCAFLREQEVNFSDQEVMDSSSRPGGGATPKREPRAGIGIIVALSPDNRWGMAELACGGSSPRRVTHHELRWAQQGGGEGKGEVSR